MASLNNDIVNLAIFFFVVSFGFFLFPSSALPRTLTESSSSSSTVVFDVIASTEQAREAISLINPQITSNSNNIVRDDPIVSTTPMKFSSTLSLKLHSRLALQKSTYSDYETLVQSRVSRDITRVKLLAEKIDNAIHSHKFSESGMRILGNEQRPKVGGESSTLTVPVASGVHEHSGEYFISIGIGQPSKMYNMILDTGSDINWLQCLPCDYCYNQNVPIFNPNSSTSYARLPCSSQHCRSLDPPATCNNDTCLYHVSYGDSSFTSGEFVTETFTFGNLQTTPNIAIGCGHDNYGLIVAAAGLLGLGDGPLSLSSQINAKSFSYCLVNRDSYEPSTLDFNVEGVAETQTANSNHSVTIPMIKNEKLAGYRFLDVTGLSVGGQPIQIPANSFKIDETGLGGMIIDSGTTITRLHAEIYNPLRDAFLNGTKNLPRAPGIPLFDTCFDLSSMKTVTIPTVSIQFSGGKSLHLPPTNYMAMVNSQGTFCFAFAPTKFPLSILGNFQQQGVRASYDLVNSVISFSYDQC